MTTEPEVVTSKCNNPQCGDNVQQKQRDKVMAGLVKASTHPDGSLGMDMEELEEIADLVMSDADMDVDPSTGLIRIKGKKSSEIHKATG